MSTVSELLGRALELPEKDRVALAHELLLSLESTQPDAGWEEAWAAELNARLDRIEQGDCKTKEWRESLADIRRSLAEGQPT